MIMADQDPDGSHIKGLLINLFHYYWPNLLRHPGFLQVIRGNFDHMRAGMPFFSDHACRTILQEFATPIVKAKKKNGKAEQAFFTLQEYENWREENEDTLGSWQIKYYKGLGTSSSAGDILRLETQQRCQPLEHDPHLHFFA